MKLDKKKVRKLLEERGWTNVILADKLGLDYSYIYRIMKGSRNIGKKFITNLMVFCEQEKLDFMDFIIMSKDEH